MRSPAFTNLHVSDGFWAITARSEEGKTTNYDLTNIATPYRKAIVDALVAAITAPGIKRIDQEGDH